MGKRIVWTIFQKELRDLFRDQKTWMGTFLIPLVMVPFVFFLMGSSFSSVEEEARSHVPVAVYGSGELLEQLQAIPGISFVSPADPHADLQNGKLRAIVTIPDDFSQQIAAGGTADLRVEYDNSNQKSVYARDVIEDAVDAYSKQIVTQRLEQAGLSAQATEPVRAVYEQVSAAEQVSGGMLAGILPLMLVVSLASGGIAVANDLIAGERERGTLESLLTAPIEANKLLTAKLLTVMVMSCASAAASLVSLSLIMRFGPFSGAGSLFTLESPLALLVVVLTVLLLAAFFAGLELMLSTLSRSIKEGQTYMSGVIFLAMVPSYMLMPLHPVDIPQHYYLLPVFSSVALLKEALYGTIDPLHILLGLGTSLLFVVLVIAFSARLFRREGAVIKP
ncbi:ABC transporter permease [Brevibacillus sp. TJ4]|uniref:ABC transporter permease n=1 Tax=Brevibacillus sp. TJ4 TaxID=3234853 RepID=UPI003BA2EA11